MSTSLSLLLIALLVRGECPSRLCHRDEQTAIARVVITRSDGSLDYAAIKDVVYKYKQFSYFNDKTARANAEAVVRKYEETGVSPSYLRPYKIIALRAAVRGPGEYTHYRLCGDGDRYTWSAKEWFKFPGGQHCFAASDQIESWQGSAAEQDKLNRAMEDVERELRREFWELKKSNEENTGC